MLIPHANYELSKVGAAEKITSSRNFVDPSLYRYEEREVAIVEATLKEGSRHIFPRQMMYVSTDEHNGIPTFTSLVKGLVHKVPSNYNQPTLASGEIDWRMIECPTTGANSPATAGYFLQQSGAVVQTSATINIYRARAFVAV